MGDDRSVARVQVRVAASAGAVRASASAVVCLLLPRACCRGPAAQQIPGSAQQPHVRHAARTPAAEHPATAPMAQIRLPKVLQNAAAASGNAALIDSPGWLAIWMHATGQSACAHNNRRNAPIVCS